MLLIRRHNLLQNLLLSAPVQNNFQDIGYCFNRNNVYFFHLVPVDYYVFQPTGKTAPLTDSEPVIAKSCLTGTSLNAEMIDVATAMLAESPSTPS